MQKSEITVEGKYIFEFYKYILKLHQIDGVQAASLFPAGL